MDFSFQVEDTCNVEQICTWKNDTVCGDVTSMQCSIVAYTGTDPAQAVIFKRNVNLYSNHYLPTRVFAGKDTKNITAIAWTGDHHQIECKTTEVEEKCTKPVEDIQWADQWWCDETEDTTTHFKEMPVCHNVTKQNCVTKWEMDDQARMIKFLYVLHLQSAGRSKDSGNVSQLICLLHIDCNFTKLI